MSRKKPKIPPYLCGDQVPENFAMVPPDIYENEKFQKLNPAAALFYLCLCSYVTSQQQKQTLYNTLKEYNNLLGLGWNDEDIKFKTWGNKRTGEFATLFVCPEKHLAQYGYTAQNASKLRKQLVDAGFIKAEYGGKGRYSAWNRNQTVWKFVFST